MSTTTTAATAANTKVIVGPVRFSYAHIWEPSAIEEGQEKKYSVSLIIPKENKKLIKQINDAIEGAKQQGKTTKFAGKIPAKLKNPLRDGDEERPDDENYASSFFINANCKTKPGIVDKDRNPIINQDEFYSGCYGYASVTFYPFNTSGNMGIACGLNHVMKTKDGDPLGGRSTADADFADLVVEDEDDFL
jgi:hypothetical protein